jgi:hypothetical protein
LFCILHALFRTWAESDSIQERKRIRAKKTRTTAGEEKKQIHVLPTRQLGLLIRDGSDHTGSNCTRGLNGPQFIASCGGDTGYQILKRALGHRDVARKSSTASNPNNVLKFSGIHFVDKPHSSFMVFSWSSEDQSRLEWENAASTMTHRDLTQKRPPRSTPSLGPDQKRICPPAWSPTTSTSHKSQIPERIPPSHLHAVRPINTSVARNTFYKAKHPSGSCQTQANSLDTDFRDERLASSTHCISLPAPNLRPVAAFLQGITYVAWMNSPPLPLVPM